MMSSVLNETLLIGILRHDNKGELRTRMLQLRQDTRQQKRTVTLHNRQLGQKKPLFKNPFISMKMPVLWGKPQTHVLLACTATGSTLQREH